MMLAGRAEVLEKETVPKLLRPPQNLTWTDLVLNPVFCRERRSATCLSCDTDILQSGTYCNHCLAYMIVTHVQFMEKRMEHIAATLLICERNYAIAYIRSASELRRH
jgi:hypothetical protein